MQMDTRDELLPCPFCGEDDVQTFGPVGWYRQWGISHSCRSFYSGAQEMFQGFPTEAEAITAWNTRAVNAYPALVEALEEARVEIGEAADKMRVLGLNHPAGNSFLAEDKALMLKLADRFDAADRRARAALALSARGDGS